MIKNYGLLIDGKWVENKKTLNVLNPFNQKKIASVSVVFVPSRTKARFPKELP